MNDLILQHLEEEAKIVEMIKLHIQQTNEEEPNHEYNFNYSEEEFNENYGYLKPVIKPTKKVGLIKNWFEQYVFYCIDSSVQFAYRMKVA